MTPENSEKTEKTEKTEKIRCPYCGDAYTEDMVVGKTQTVSKGVRTTCAVVHCTCGKNFKGEVKGTKKLKPRI